MGYGTAARHIEAIKDDLEIIGSKIARTNIFPRLQTALSNLGFRKANIFEISPFYVKTEKDLLSFQCKTCLGIASEAEKDHFNRFKDLINMKLFYL
ncbi:hypothetical protein HOG98_02890 [bacterium]|jgi:hypothetical protein|nr:hypothetical protein [bacterium]